jgi:hypothetical protein
MNREQVKKKFDEVQEAMAAVAKAFPWEDRAAYLSWMAQTLEYVTYTTRILAQTGASFPLRQTALASRFIQHATEEKGHEKLLHHDAKALGADLSKLPLLPEAEAFHKSVYYWIYQGRPAVVMGWALFLEGYAVKNGGCVYERAVAAYGPKPTSFLKVHTQEDPDHVDKAFAVLDGFSSEELADVVHGLELYAKLYANIYRAISEGATKHDAQAA